MTERELLRRTADLAADWVERSVDRRVPASASIRELRTALDGPLPAGPTDPTVVIEELARNAEPGLTAMGSGRYFGFVIGGTLPAALAADWLVSAWDQNAGLVLPTPTTTVIEETAGRWLKELLGLPSGASFALVTGCQMAHVTALAAARGAVLARHGWDLAERGLQGGPPVRVLAGAKKHVTIDRALRLLGIGTAQVNALPVDDQGRMDVAALRGAIVDGGGPTIVCAQAGEVNTGAFDDFDAIADACGDTGAWLHVDGAFGLWAAASQRFRHLTAGCDRADSWATDAHKWLNVPYDCGVAFCADPAAQRAAMSSTAAYLVQVDESEGREPMAYYARVLAASPVRSGLRGHPFAGSKRHRRARRALLRCGHTPRRPRGRDPGLHGPERGRAQPGACPLPRRRDDHRRAQGPAGGR